MSLLHQSMRLRVLSQGSRPALRAFHQAAARRQDATKPPSPPPPRPNTDESLAAKQTESGMIREEDAKQAYPRHQPDYNVAADYRVSAFSPIPKRVMDGSEEGDVVPAAVLSGAPVDLQARRVVIYRPTKTATQSGDWNSHNWRMDWDPLPKGHRWENPLMGWQSTGDIQNSERLYFNTKEDAIRFANKQGYEYFVQEPNERKFLPKAYATQFMHSPKKLKNIRTK